jgi:surface polysaccharide O-acyltransferase-like enzyme
VQLLLYAVDVVEAVEISALYVFQFVLGYRLSIWEPDDRQCRVVYGMGILGAAVSVVGTLALSRCLGQPVQVLFDPQSPHITAVAAAIFVFAKRHLKHLPSWADGLARHSFGVYLAHVLFIEKLAEGGITVLSGHPMVAAPVLTVAITAGCCLVSALLGRIPWLGKRII